MEDEREKATELLKSGRYYDEAMKWYKSRYIFPKTQIAYLLILASASVVFTLVSISGTLSIFPLKDRSEIIVKRPLRPNERMAVKPIGNPREEASIGYLKFMLKEYVIAREEYNPKKLDRDFSFVVETSSDEIFTEYLAIADQNQNPNHPVWQYGTQVIKDISVTKIEIPELDSQLETYVADKEYTAIVSYTSALVFADNLEQKQKMQSELKFKFRKITVDQNTNSIKELPKLQITSYKTKQL